VKIIAWNCNMAFRKKAGHILEHKPDIVVISECEQPSKLKFDAGAALPTDIVWHGKNPNKGLGVLSYNGYTLELLDIHDPEIKTILPIALSKGRFKCILLAIWAYNTDDKDYTYIGQVWKAIHRYESLLKNRNVILAGDFNSNVFWDRPKKRTNHSMVVEKLSSHKIYSAYHKHFDLTDGQEAHPTYFLYRHEDKPYHIDYCFASAALIKKMESVEVGSYNQWSTHSDHKPVIINFKI
jgi:exonuclease III